VTRIWHAWEAWHRIGRSCGSNRTIMKKKDPRTNNEPSLENNPQAQGPKRGQTQGDRDRQKGSASTLNRELARMSKPNPNATKGGGRGRRGTSDNI
jgi:hypothetical protein